MVCIPREIPFFAAQLAIADSKQEFYHIQTVI